MGMGMDWMANGRADARHERDATVAKVAAVTAEEAHRRADRHAANGRREDSLYWEGYAAEVESWDS